MGNDCCSQVVRSGDALAAAEALARQQTIADDFVSEAALPVLFIWHARPALLVAQRDTQLPFFAAASAASEAAGWPVCVRKSGGGACPIGCGTVQISLVEPATSAATINNRYDALAGHVQSAFRRFGVETQIGSVDDAYCPGKYDLAVGGRKIAGLSQHWFGNRHGKRCIVTAASINIAEGTETLAEVVNRFYRAAGSPQRCRSTALTCLQSSSSQYALSAGPNLMARFAEALSSVAMTTGPAPVVIKKVDSGHSVSPGRAI